MPGYMGLIGISYILWPPQSSVVGGRVDDGGGKIGEVVW